MTALYEAKGILSELCGQSHISYRFYTDLELDEIQIVFDYNAGVVSDENEGMKIIHSVIDRDGGCLRDDETERLKDKWKSFHPIGNLVTVSLDDENGFRGASHRKRPEGETLIIGKDHSSPGYIKGSIPRGYITVTVSAHSLTSSCEYNLKVYGDGENNV